MAALPKAVVLFGASGFIGRNIKEKLKDQVELLVGVNASGQPVSGCALTVAVNALDSIPKLPPDTVIINVAAFRYFASRFGKQQAVILSNNVDLTNTIYSFALERGITELRVASSSAVYPADWKLLDDSVPLDLDAWPHAGEAAYAWSKRWGEVVAELWHRRLGISTISLRLSNPYGPFDTLDESEAHVATAFVIRALSNVDEFEVRGDPYAERDFVFSGDVATAFIESLKLRGVQTSINCVSGHATQVIELARIAMRAAGIDRPIRTKPPSVHANQSVKTRFATASRLREIMPELPPFHGLDEGMRITMGWYRDALS